MNTGTVLSPINLSGASYAAGTNFDIIQKTDQIKLPETAESMKVLKGGPVETGRGFVLHSSDFYIEDATLRIDAGSDGTGREER